MARQQLTPQPLTKTALLNPTFSAASGTGCQFQNSGHEILEIINGSTASTATINVAVTVEGQTVTPFTVTLPTSNTTPQRLGPFSSHFTQPDGNVYIDFSSITGLTLALVQIPGVS